MATPTAGNAKDLKTLGALDRSRGDAPQGSRRADPANLGANPCANGTFLVARPWLYWNGPT